MVATDRPLRKLRPPAPPPLTCRTCGRPFARVQNGVLVIESKHGSETHTNVISLTQLRALLEGLDAPLTDS
jgi:hypothetical protein